VITYTQGNLLEADAEVLVNTVNTVGVMGKGIALMFKERFPSNYKEYQAAAKRQELRTGKMFAVEVRELGGPRWVVNFPTKQHWKAPSRLKWIVEGLKDLRRFVLEHSVRSIAIPPLGAGNGGLQWSQVRAEISRAMSDLPDVEIIVFEPTAKYQNVAKRTGVQKLTPARALIAELVRRYWVLGMECSLLEIQKLAWFLERTIEQCAPSNPLDLRFQANKYGPYADRLTHLLDSLDGSYLHCEKRISDASPLDVIWFDDSRKDYLQTYLAGAEVSPYRDSLEKTAALIDGFESPFGMELLSTIDWLLANGTEPTVKSVRDALQNWPGGPASAQRKLQIFDDRDIAIALTRLANASHAGGRDMA
jgi:O-acetyl-ADP-ribose deacetylase (regulator of RNase III)